MPRGRVFLTAARDWSVEYRRQIPKLKTWDDFDQDFRVEFPDLEPPTPNAVRDWVKKIGEFTETSVHKQGENVGTRPSTEPEWQTREHNRDLRNAARLLTALFQSPRKDTASGIPSASFKTAENPKDRRSIENLRAHTSGSNVWELLDAYQAAGRELADAAAELTADAVKIASQSAFHLDDDWGSATINAGLWLTDEYE
jgi:hypothetical protein